MDTATPRLASIGIDIGKEVFHIVGFSSGGKMPFVARSSDLRSLRPSKGYLPKAKPVVLTTPGEVVTSMTAPSDEALKLQRQLPDGLLRIVAWGVKEDSARTVS